jgi:hypothetical protein
MLPPAEQAVEIRTSGGGALHPSSSHRIDSAAQLHAGAMIPSLQIALAAFWQKYVVCARKKPGGGVAGAMSRIALPRTVGRPHLVFRNPQNRRFR